MQRHDGRRSWRVRVHREGQALPCNLTTGEQTGRKAAVEGLRIERHRLKGSIQYGSTALCRSGGCTAYSSCETSHPASERVCSRKDAPRSCVAQSPDQYCTVPRSVRRYRPRFARKGYETAGPAPVSWLSMSTVSYVLHTVLVSYCRSTTVNALYRYCTKLGIETIHHLGP
jgi:hypothetical protein